MRILLEGTICAGKTSAIRKVKAMSMLDGMKIVLKKEPVKEWAQSRVGNMLLEVMKDEKKAAIFQTYAMTTFRRSRDEVCPDMISIEERSLLSCHEVFQRTLQDLKKIDDMEQLILDELFQLFMKNEQIDGIVYIDITPEVAMERIIKRNHEADREIAKGSLQNKIKTTKSWGDVRAPARASDFCC